ncbi:hypothetical protein NE237_003323 [Protea cynaroides]|uniref:Uncharacterized protein n=1 Tax=Protea cynaroides TaxID=273540 RepID=A0A9Q0KH76_9MAGN|nr:hypothetical protein NE237_003323 [Protea cynaroides]
MSFLELHRQGRGEGLELQSRMEDLGLHQRVNVQGLTNLVPPVEGNWADVSDAERSYFNKVEEQVLEEDDLQRSPVVVSGVKVVVGKGLVSELSSQGDSTRFVGTVASQPTHVDLEVIAAAVAGNQNQDGGVSLVEKLQGGRFTEKGKTKVVHSPRVTRSEALRRRVLDVGALFLV